MLYNFKRRPLEKGTGLFEEHKGEPGKGLHHIPCYKKSHQVIHTVWSSSDLDTPHYVCQTKLENTSQLKKATFAGEKGNYITSHTIESRISKIENSNQTLLIKL